MHYRCDVPICCSCCYISKSKFHIEWWRIVSKFNKPKNYALNLETDGLKS